MKRQYVKSFTTFINENHIEFESIQWVPNVPKIREWFNTPFVPTSNTRIDDREYGKGVGIPPKDWDDYDGRDMFKSLIADNLNIDDYLIGELQEVFNFPNTNLYKYFRDNPSGFNEDFNWNKFENFGGALYDIWEYFSKVS